MQLMQECVCVYVQCVYILRSVKYTFLKVDGLYLAVTLEKFNLAVPDSSLSLESIHLGQEQRHDSKHYLTTIYGIEEGGAAYAG